MNGPTLSLVIPAYNEEKRIGETLRRVGSYFSTISTYRRLMMPLPLEVKESRHVVLVLQI